MNVVISMPVHENYDCVINYLENVQKYVKTCRGVVIHVSGDSDISLYSNLVKASEDQFRDFLFVNPTRYRTSKPGEAGNVTGLSTVYSSNFRYISKLFKFDIYSLCNSNEMFVREGLDDLVNNNLYQFQVLNAPNNGKERLPHPVGGPDWNSGVGCWAEILKNKYNCEFPEFGWVVGSLMPFTVWERLSSIILDELSQEDWLLKGGVLALEEYIIPTLIFKLYPELYEKLIPVSYVLCPQDYNPHAWSIPENLVLDIRNGVYPNRFSVKRVPRDISHPIRVFINKL